MAFSHYLNFKRQDFEFEEFVIFKIGLVFFFLPRKKNDLIYPVHSKVPLTYLQGEKTFFGALKTFQWIYEFCIIL